MRASGLERDGFERLIRCSVIASMGLLSGLSSAQTKSSNSDCDPACLAEDGSSACQAPCDGREKALQLHDAANEQYAAGEYQDALDSLLKAVEIDPGATELHYNIALIAEKLGHLEQAIEHYELALTTEKVPDERAALKRTIARLKGALASGDFEEPTTKSQPDVVVPPPRAPVLATPAPHDTSYYPWIAFSGGVTMASLLTAGVLAGVASSTHPEDEAVTGPDISVADLQADADAAHRLAIGADVMLGVGAVAALATVGFVVAHSYANEEPATGAGLVLLAQPGGGSVLCRF